MGNRRTTGRMGALAVSLAAVALAAGACGDDGGGGAASGDRTVDVTMTDNAFAPERVQVRQGETVTFRFTNDGRAVHEAYFGDRAAQEDHAAEMSGGHDDEGMDDHSGMGMGDDDVVVVDPGETGELTRTFQDAGTVLIGCHQPGHWESGMKATVDIA